MPEKNSKSIRIQYFRSSIGRPEKQKRVVNGLGFRKLNQIVELVDTPQTRGMVAKVPHLVRVLDGE